MRALGLLSPVVEGSQSKQKPLDIREALIGLGVDPASEGSAGAYDRYVKASRLAARQLGVKGGEVGVVINGRVSLLCVNHKTSG